jgi:EAL domain-containing protein (putative c-di-GMP-specific phosphodiesterase class I)
VKLDRSLISGIDGNPRSLSIARAIIGLCEGLGLEITAEGIERREQLAPLLGAKGLSIQGFLLAKPLPAGEVLDARAQMPAAWRALRGPAGLRRLTSVA